MTDFAAGYGRPAFDPSGKLVCRRAMPHGDRAYRVGEEMPRLDLTTRHIAILWDQGWIDTLPLDAHKGKGKAAAAVELGK